MSARSLWAVALVVSGCNDLDPMQVQARDNPYSEDENFADARAMRPTVPGTMPREWYLRQAAYVPLAIPDGGLVDPWSFPLPLTREVLLRGRDQFETWCAPCHGLLADGRSIVARNMRLRAPPALYGPGHERHPPRGVEEGLPDAGTGALEPASPGWAALPHPPGFYYQAITEGYGLMPSYAPQIPPEERWMVVAWLRVLAYSQLAPLSAAPPDVRDQLQRSSGTRGAP
ncbi:cytochrome c [Myxococcus sp. K15C18031901]|uniref:c-type cytochrome n=1 Tax=Myxococcus dinghuensis TaxID=2906761 RepID=UPI0020A7090B|nr:cytochrome c [Myxococcus dinghuensis]MCP3100475.1 cytochrome c [Myxococcus dinghuensis]